MRVDSKWVKHRRKNDTLGREKRSIHTYCPRSPGIPVWGDTFLVRQREYSDYPVIPRALQRTQPSTRLTPVALDDSLWDPVNPRFSSSTWGLQKQQAAPASPNGILGTRCPANYYKPRPWLTLAPAYSSGLGKLT